MVDRIAQWILVSIIFAEAAVTWGFLINTFQINQTTTIVTYVHVKISLATIKIKYLLFVLFKNNASFLNRGGSSRDMYTFTIRLKLHEIDWKQVGRYKANRYIKSELIFKRNWAIGRPICMFNSISILWYDANLSLILRWARIFYLYQ
jgi:hypothetical protein